MEKQPVTFRMVSAKLIGVLLVLWTTTSANQICKDTLKALIEARHEQFYRDFNSLRHSVNRERQAMKKLMEQFNVMKGSGTYTRWGRTSCPKSAQLVYKGYVGGTHYKHNGPSKSLCLPDNPQYSSFLAGVNSQGLIYGTEYETHTAMPSFKKFYNHDVPCAVCKTKRSSVIMIPARNTCTKGWKREYHGYLMSGHHGSSGVPDYVCVDGKPETIAGGHANNDHSFLYMVEARCGSLPCPPYNNEKELTCVVCSA